MSQGTTVINRFGKIIGWNSTKVRFGGRTFEAIEEIEYEETQDIEGVKGNGGYDIGIGEGNISTQGSITLLKEEVIAMQRSLPPGKKFTDMAAQDIPVVFKLNDGTIYKDVLRNARWMKNHGTIVKQGDKKIAVKFPLYFSHVAPEGVDPT